MITTRAVILARGLGTRMRAEDASVPLTPDQRRAADAGFKAMMPVNGRPFLDYVLSGIADAGIREVALVVAPEHETIRRYYSSLISSRVALSYVVQPEPLGTANALLAVEQWAAGTPFLTLNGDNLYPLHALEPLASLREPGLPAFDADDLVRTSNIPAERIRSFAEIDVGADGYLHRIVEKPTTPAALKLVSMNCWRFDERIFEACRDVPRSVRGEYELPQAVLLAIERGVGFKTFPARGPVLDLSSRVDARDVERRLAGVIPRP